MVVPRKKSQVRINIAINTMTIIYSQLITKADLANLYTDIRFCVADLKPGFYVIEDFSVTEVMQLDAIDIFKKICKYLMTHKFGEIVRVVPVRNLLNIQLLNSNARIHGYIAKYVQTLEEAEKHFEENLKRGSVRIQLDQLHFEYLSGEKSGSGHIQNMSVGGCAVTVDNFKPTLKDRIEIRFTLFARGKDKGQDFCFESVVVRIENYGFAVQFLDTDSSTQIDELYNCLTEITGEEKIVK